MNRHRLDRLILACGLLVAASGLSAHAGGQASGYFRIADTRLDVRHAIAVVEEESASGEDSHTLVFLSAVPLDAGKVAAAFDAMAAVRDQEPAGGYLRLCIDAEGDDCGLFFSPEGFNSGGYGELTFAKREPARIAGRFVLAEPEDFMGEAYQFDLNFDTAITPAPGTALPPGGGEPGKAYNAYLAALAQGDFAALRTMAGDDGAWQYPEDDPTAAKEALKSARDGQPLQAQIERGRQHGGEAVLWVRGVDRDDIPRAGRVLMVNTGSGWRFEESDLDSVEE
jgi:hypothetical protein